MAIKMGFEGLIYYGTAGSTASTQITNHREAGFNLGGAEGDTTTQGDGSSPPIETSRPASSIHEPTFTLVVDDSDAAYTTLMTAAANKTNVALRMKDYSAGKGFDGDCWVQANSSRPFGSEQTVNFTFKPTKAAGRTPQAYV